jgi:hypothetical protein
VVEDERHPTARTADTDIETATVWQLHRLSFTSHSQRLPDLGEMSPSDLAGVRPD